MKKVFLLLLATGLLLACNPGNDNKENSDSTPTDENHAGHDKKPEGLVLNNGAKWKADSLTMVNMALLQNTVSGAKQEKLENYTQTAAQLQDGLNKMISECKMKGADHDALHQWLEPLMKKVKALNSESSIDSAATRLNDIDRHLKLFAQYFE